MIGLKYHTIPELPDLNLGSMVITPGDHVSNLGVIMDTKFTMQPHIYETFIRSCKLLSREYANNLWSLKNVDTICC